MNALSEQSVGQALGSVIDPELGASLIDLNVVRRISVDDGSVSIELVLTAPGCPLAGWIVEQVREAVGALPGAQSVDVTLLDEPWQPPGDEWQTWLDAAAGQGRP